MVLDKTAEFSVHPGATAGQSRRVTDVWSARVQRGEVVTVRGKRTPVNPWCYGFGRARNLAWCPWRASKPVVSPANRIFRLVGASRLRECGLSFAPRGRLAATTHLISSCHEHAKRKSNGCSPSSTLMPPAPILAPARSTSQFRSNSTSAPCGVSTPSPDYHGAAATLTDRSGYSTAEFGQPVN